jgi:hypothetical protein
MLMAYVDETGTHNGAQFCALAGFIIDACAAVSLESAWRAECLNYPPSPNFHMQVAQDVNSAIWEWGDDCKYSLQEKISCRDARTAALVNATLSYTSLGINLWLGMKDFEAHFKGKTQERFDTPYFILFYFLLFGVAKQMVKAKKSDQIQFVFDNQLEYGPAALEWHSDAVEALKATYPAAANIIALRPQFADDDCVIPLKSADLLAWHIQRELNGRVRDANTRNILEKFEKSRGVGSHITAPMLDQLVHILSRYPPHH